MYHCSLLAKGHIHLSSREEGKFWFHFFPVVFFTFGHISYHHHRLPLYWPWNSTMVIRITKCHQSLSTLAWAENWWKFNFAWTTALSLWVNNILITCLSNLSSSHWHKSGWVTSCNYWIFMQKISRLVLYVFHLRPLQWWPGGKGAVSTLL